MNRKRTTLPQRREFLRGLCRNLMLGLLGGLTAMLSFRKWSRAADEECINLEICRGCPAYDGCELPPAQTFRRENGRVQKGLSVMKRGAD